MLMIRFQRIGRKNDPAFRIAVLEKTAGPKAGKYVELVGTYNPKTKASTVQSDRIKEWMAKGAQLSPSVSNLLIGLGVIEGKKMQVISNKNLEKNILKQRAADAAAAEAARLAAEKEAAAAKAAEEAAAAAEAEAEAKASAKAAEESAPVEETPAPEEVAPAAPIEEAPSAPVESVPVVEEAPTPVPAPEEEVPAEPAA
jgi:small subunit ribosomal protein S16